MNNWDWKGDFDWVDDEMPSDEGAMQINFPPDMEAYQNRWGAGSNVYTDEEWENMMLDFLIGGEIE